MRTRALATMITLVCSVGALSCQTYAFEPIVPLSIAQTTQTNIALGRNFMPNLALLVDTSGSMNFASDTTNPACPARCGEGSSVCPASCPTRISELKEAMTTFLSGKPIGRYGLLLFPNSPANNNDGCGLPSAPAFPAAEINTADEDENTAALQAQAAKVLKLIGDIKPSGGTPTNGAIRWIGETPSHFPSLYTKDKGENIVILLTDGLPNCNESNRNSCANPAACRCTLALTPQGNDSCVEDARYCRKGCLDRDGAAGAVAALRGSTIKTIVVGFGADLAGGDAAETLNDLATVGGFARTCDPTKGNADCGNDPQDPCTIDPIDNTGYCAKRFYAARNGAELQKRLLEITKVVGGDPCKKKLSASPPTDEYLSVIWNDEPLPKAGNWTYAAGQVTFIGSRCDQILASTPANPINLSFRVAEVIR